MQQTTSYPMQTIDEGKVWIGMEEMRFCGRPETTMAS